MVSRIKSGQSKVKADNPSPQDIVRALKTGVKASIPIIQKLDEKHYQATKLFMDAVEPFLPAQMAIAWRAIEAFRETGVKRYR